MLQGKFVLNDADYSPLSIYGVGTFMAFSGQGAYRNRGGCGFIPDRGPIPPGKYWIVERSKGGIYSKLNDFTRDTVNKIVYGAEFGRADWFSLYKDGFSVDDWIWFEGVKRGLFRLHPGTISQGCITLKHDSDFALIRNALLRVKPVPVPCMRNLFAMGYIEVISNGTGCF